jgi:predicted nucleic acid-binding protein
MRTAIDTNVFSAIWSNEPSAPALVAQLGTAKLDGALLISPVVFAELHAYPGATQKFLAGFLQTTAVAVDLRLEESVWNEAGKRFALYVIRRRKSSGTPKRLLADFIIGAHALMQADRLLTLDPRRYAQDFPELRLLPLPRLP